MKVRLGVLLGLALGAMTLPAIADPVNGYATTDLNIRGGAGTNFPVIGNIMAGNRVQYDNCANNWCEVDAFGGKGYVAANYVSDKPVEERSTRRSGDGYGYGQAASALSIMRGFIGFAAAAGAFAPQPPYGYYGYGYYGAPYPYYRHSYPIVPFGLPFGLF